MTVDLTRAKWNYRAAMQFVAFASVNVIGGWALYTGKISWSEWGATVGVIDTAIATWMVKPDPSEVQQ